jgi:acyl dehydratase
MATENKIPSLVVGDEVARRDFALTRESLVRYAGASGDFNPIHYRDDVAQSVGLEGVLAHGMLTMGLAIQPVVSWLGQVAPTTGRVLAYHVRFTKPVYVPASGSVGLTVGVTVSKIDDPAPGHVTLTLLVHTDAGVSVLGKAFAVVSFS